jgi:hypothetical protein
MSFSIVFLVSWFLHRLHVVVGFLLQTLNVLTFTYLLYTIITINSNFKYVSRLSFQVSSE